MSTGIHRKVASSRKRLSKELLHRTPKRGKIKVDTPTKCLDAKKIHSVKKVSSTDCANKNESVLEWLDNSFLGPGTTCALPKGKQTQAGLCNLQEDNIMRSSRRTSNTRLNYKAFALYGDNGSCQQPKRLIQQKERSSPTSQHDSFNQSDPLIDDLDIAATLADAASTPQKSPTKVGSMFNQGANNDSKKRTGHHRTKSSSKIAASTDTTAVANRYKQDDHIYQAVDPVIAGHRSLNIASSCAQAGSNALNETSGFESDDSFFANISIPHVESGFTCDTDAGNFLQGDEAFETSLQEKDRTVTTDSPRSAVVQPVGTSDSGSRHPQSTSVVCGDPVTDSSTPISFRERLKNTLKQNANKCPTPQSGRLLSKLRHETLDQALREAVEMQQQVTDHSIGPFFGLPSKVETMLAKHKGIKSLYAWQTECLSLPAVKKGRNLIYSLPTSGGKTLVAEILLLRSLLCQQKNVIFILPFVSIVQEKVRSLSPFAVELDFLVEEYAGSKGSMPPKTRPKKKSVYVCTIEKANSIVNSLIEHNRLESVGLVIVDELHMLGEGGSRGATLEMSLAKVMHASSSTQIVGMSATLSNIQDLQDFIGAEVYSNDFRPVELREFVKMEDMIYEIQSKALCPQDRMKHDRITSFKYDKAMTRMDPDHVAGLVLEVAPEKSCLVFCPTKKNCENVAELLCRLMPSELKEVKREERKALLKALAQDGNGEVCPVLRRTVAYGVAYHHSGLTMDERKLLEEAYSEGTLCVLACTSTLAAGVNLPAKRVVLRSPYVAGDLLSRSQYKQMVGRAGRAGLDSSGESILILQKKDKLKVIELVGGPYDSCLSSLLYEKGKGIRGLLLTAIGLKITTSVQSVEKFLQRTLCHVQRERLDLDLERVAGEALQQLGDAGLVSCQRSTEGAALLEVTPLGRAVFKGPVDIDRGGKLYEDLHRASHSLCVESHLHLLYLVTPYDLVANIKPDWMTYLNELSCLDEGDMQVAAAVGVTESYVTNRAAGQRVKKAVDEFAMSRFYVALMLYHLWRQKSIWEVAARFQQPRGFLQQLLNSAASFAACVTHFCQELPEFWAYQDLLSNFVQRLSYCVASELIPLMEIPGVKIGRARQLYNAGYKSLSLVAYADPEQLVKTIEYMPRKAAKQIVASAQMLLQEKAESLIDEAGQLIAVPIDAPEAERIAMKTPINSQLSEAISLDKLPSQDRI